MTEFEKMREGKFYNPVEKGIIVKRTHARMLADRFNRTHAWNIVRRTHLIHKMFPHHGKGAFFEPPLHIEYGVNTTFGDDFFMNFNCMILDVSKVTIGDGVMFGPNVTIATPMHPMLAEERMVKDYPDGHHDLEYSKPITIGNYVWLASGVTVCGGVTIGDNVVVGAGSVVTRDLPPNTFCAGVPCKVIRQLTDADRIFPTT